MTKWDKDWTGEARNIFEALGIERGDRLGILFNPVPAGKERLAGALEKEAARLDIPCRSIPVTLDEDFEIGGLEAELNKFFEGAGSANRKFFFTTAHEHFGPSRRAVHKLLSVDPAKLCGYTISLPTDDAAIVSDLAGTSPNDLLKRGEELKKILSAAVGIRVTSRLGTDVSFDWDPKRRKYLISAGFPHRHEDRWDNMGGEVFTAPLHETVNGRLVIDGAIANIGLVDGVVVVDIAGGRGVINKSQSKASEKMLDAFGRQLDMFPCASVVGEFGVGTTPGLKLRGELLNDEKVEGTIHFAFGDSYASDGSGGENDCDNHTDCVITSPTVGMTVNGKIVRLMEDGRFVL